MYSSSPHLLAGGATSSSHSYPPTAAAVRMTAGTTTLSPPSAPSCGRHWGDTVHHHHYQHADGEEGAHHQHSPSATLLALSTLRSELVSLSLEWDRFVEGDVMSPQPLAASGSAYTGGVGGGARPSSSLYSSPIATAASQSTALVLKMNGSGSSAAVDASPPLPFPPSQLHHRHDGAHNAGVSWGAYYQQTLMESTLRNSSAYCYDSRRGIAGSGGGAANGANPTQRNSASPSSSHFLQHALPSKSSGAASGSPYVPAAAAGSSPHSVSSLSLLVSAERTFAPMASSRVFALLARLGEMAARRSRIVAVGREIERAEWGCAMMMGAGAGGPSASDAPPSPSATTTATADASNHFGFFSPLRFADVSTELSFAQSLREHGKGPLRGCSVRGMERGQGHGGEGAAAVNAAAPPQPTLFPAFVRRELGAINATAARLEGDMRHCEAQMLRRLGAADAHPQSQSHSLFSNGSASPPMSRDRPSPLAAMAAVSNGSFPRTDAAFAPAGRGSGSGGSEVDQRQLSDNAMRRLAEALVGSRHHTHQSATATAATTATTMSGSQQNDAATAPAPLPTPLHIHYASAASDSDKSFLLSCGLGEDCARRLLEQVGGGDGGGVEDVAGGTRRGIASTRGSGDPTVCSVSGTAPPSAQSNGSLPAVVASPPPVSTPPPLPITTLASPLPPQYQRREYNYGSADGMNGPSSSSPAAQPFNPLTYRATEMPDAFIAMQARLKERADLSRERLRAKGALPDGAIDTAGGAPSAIAAAAAAAATAMVNTAAISLSAGLLGMAASAVGVADAAAGRTPPAAAPHPIIESSTDGTTPPSSSDSVGAAAKKSPDSTAIVSGGANAEASFLAPIAPSAAVDGASSTLRSTPPPSSTHPFLQSSYHYDPHQAEEEEENGEAAVATVAAASEGVAEGPPSAPPTLDASQTDGPSVLAPLPSAAPSAAVAIAAPSAPAEVSDSIGGTTNTANAAAAAADAPKPPTRKQVVVVTPSDSALAAAGGGGGVGGSKPSTPPPSGAAVVEAFGTVHDYYPSTAGDAASINSNSGAANVNSFDGRLGLYAQGLIAEGVWTVHTKEPAANATGGGGGAKEGRKYYYNKDTKETVWDLQKALRQQFIDACAESLVARKVWALVAPAKEGGKAYYYNKGTKETCWDLKKWIESH